MPVSEWRSFLTNEYHRFNTMTLSQLRTRLGRIKKAGKLSAFVYVAYSRHYDALAAEAVLHADVIGVRFPREIDDLIRTENRQAQVVHLEQEARPLQMSESERATLSLRALQDIREENKLKFQEREARRNPKKETRVRKVRFLGDK